RSAPPAPGRRRRRSCKQRTGQRLRDLRHSTAAPRSGPQPPAQSRWPPPPSPPREAPAAPADRTERPAPQPLLGTAPGAAGTGPSGETDVVSSDITSHLELGHALIAPAGGHQRVMAAL
ncbi:hypothetical protein PKCEKB_PKCEKB_18580, partial [Dysosmobacter welbionis]